MAEEARLIEKIKKYVKGKGGKVIKIAQNGFSELGVPDLIIMIPDRQTCFVEAKAKGRKPSLIQYVKIAEIEKAGGEAFWTDSFDDFESKINR